MVRRILIGLGVFLMLMLIIPQVKADDGPFLTGYPVFGKPHHIAIEGPGRVWFTMPEQNLIGSLVVTSTSDYRVMTYTTTITEPFDIVYAASTGGVWFTGREGNQIGYLDAADGTITAFQIPTADSVPVGIDLLDTAPQRIWFVEQAANQLGQLVVTSTTDYAFYEYPLPVQYVDAGLWDIAVENADSVWFTAPGANRLGRFKPSLWPESDSFDFHLVSNDAEPQALVIMPASSPRVYFTDAPNDRLAYYYPTTLWLFLFYPLPQAGSGLYALDVAAGRVWFTERTGQRVGWLNVATGQVREFSVGTGELLGIGVDSSGCAWLAESTAGKISSWCPPYFHFVYLPMVLR